MTLIVADTGPINYLIQIGRVDLLPKLVGKVVMPEWVRAELLSASAPEAVRNWANQPPGWIAWQEPAVMIPIKPDLSLADCAAISLAKELNALLLMDDRRGRREAADHAVATIGTVGILEAAAAKGFVQLTEVLTQLKSTNMFLSEMVITRALERDEMRRRKP